MELTKKEINLARQWFNAVEDLCPEYLTKADRVLVEKIKMALGWKPKITSKRRSAYNRQKTSG